jgi:hypothetical protein
MTIRGVLGVLPSVIVVLSSLFVSGTLKIGRHEQLCNCKRSAVQLAAHGDNYIPDQSHGMH